MPSTVTEPAPPVTETVPPAAQAAAPSVWQRYRRLWVVAALVVAATALYLAGDAFFAYTADAYVRSDLVAIAPEVSGVVASVAVADNQPVAAGDLLATIDPKPFQLDVALKQQQVARLEAAVSVKTQTQAGDAASVDAAAAALQLAQQQYDRAKALTGEQFASQEQLDKASDQLRAAQDRLAVRRNQSDIDNREIAEAKAQVEVARAELALAQYNLSRARLTAPVAGFVNNLTLRPGAYARAGEALIGIVDGSQWRVVANFKENIAAGVTPGRRVWVWLDADPWRFHAGHVQGVGRGIARSEAPSQLLPYVAPTTDWIRLRRRLQVTILLDDPPRQGLFMGADARVFFFR